MGWLRNVIRKVMPNDSGPPRCGYGLLSLSETHPFTRACMNHDFHFGQAEKGSEEKSLDAVDIDLFRQMAFIAMNQPDDKKKLALMLDLCMVWPLARVGGRYLWDGKD